QVWTCSMHPQIRLPGPGKCPICFMDLIPVAAPSTQGSAGPRELALSPQAVALMGIETAPVVRRFAEARVRLVGMVGYDESRLSYITAWVPGRLDRLFVDYTGVTVKQGDHLVSLYSPDLVSAQEELLQAAAAAARMAASQVPSVREASEATVVAAREKLRLWGMAPEQIAEVERRGTAADHVTIEAPVGGVVVHKDARQGMYVETGTPIYTIADLTRVWVELEAYESDLPWVRYGHDVEFTVEAFPGEVFHGTVAFIQPVLDEGSRTVKVRVNVPNDELRLKPGMFVSAEVKARVAAGGRVMSRELAGKWISPMHPEIVRDHPGKCDVCGMPLVRAEDLGYVDDGPANAPLVVPATAPLSTGTRAVVYVEVQGRDAPTYAGREVVLGPRAGDCYLVSQGLSEGERVVTRGAFKLDAEMQIQARPSMMSPAGGRPATGHQHGGAGVVPGSAAPVSAAPPLDPAFRRQLAALAAAYLEIGSALAADDGPRASQAARTGLTALQGVDMALLQGQDHLTWMGQLAALEESLTAIRGAAGIDGDRPPFAALSAAMAAAVRHFGAPAGTLYRAFCPMALAGGGASWLQTDRQIRNPYFGAAMPECGDIQEVLE
ncbi:MAG: efflux RND transporter periplasmic adaptor subunit, partial [Gemmatimonadota bacterium]